MAAEAAAPAPVVEAPPVAPAAPAAPKVAQGTLIDQTLERPLRPGEVSLDELERAFRETAIEVAPAPEAAPAPAPVAEQPKAHVKAEAKPKE